ncbi:hypothetical protein BJ508DRAFT_305719 [Ascobolus immersus RN42]|uniref:THO complex subunit 2 n=1 Tax=Ascobolus immersus RN42 TaxID=1160509 RepID=A0A3N4IDN0_ASCIM|nr:hypothetical protein BJ508DRAFT_305719 [Ascobolus immersus RN42]
MPPPNNNNGRKRKNSAYGGGNDNGMRNNGPQHPQFQQPAGREGMDGRGGPPRDPQGRRPPRADNRRYSGQQHGGGMNNWGNQQQQHQQHPQHMQHPQSQQDNRQGRPDSRGQRTPRNRSPFRPPQPQPTQGPNRLNHGHQSSATPQPPLFSSQQQQPPQAEMEVDPPRPVKEPGPFFLWEHVTDDRLRSWANTGETEIVNEAREALEADDSVSICVIYMEILRAGLENRLPPDVAGRLLNRIMTVESTAVNDVDLTSLFLSTISSIESIDQGRQNLSAIIRHAGVSDQSLKEHLELPSLMTLSLTPDNFPKIVARVQTHMLYRQKKFNLLREESEGYSKLAAELFSTAYLSSPLPRAGETLNNIKALIGTFELDPARVLDIIFDLCATSLVSNCRFFVRLLQLSPWWPTTSPIGDFTPTGCPGLQGKEREDRDQQFFDDLREKGVEALFKPTSCYSTFPDGGNSVASQILGFKFQYYQYPDVKAGPNGNAPENLFMTAVILMRIGLVSFADIWPHLSPEDDELQVEKENYRRFMEEKAGRTKLNALAMAGALGDEGSSMGSYKEREKEKAATPKPEERKEKEGDEKDWHKKLLSNQKLLMLRCLLALGAIPEAMVILSKFPWIAGPFPEIADHIHRIVHHSIEPLYARLRPLSNATGQINNVSKKIAGTLPNGGIELIERPKKRGLSVLLAFYQGSEDTYGRFFWEEWTEGIPICQTSDDLIALCDTFLRFSGSRVGRDPILMGKICRIGRRDLHDASKSGDKEVFSKRLEAWSKVIREILLPAVAMTSSNIGAINEVWRLLDFYSTPQRYAFYGEWLTVWNKRIPELRLRVSEAEKETKDLLKRISKTNVKQMARALAKVATGSPGTVFAVALSQIEAYDNLVDVVVDAARYFTILGYDVLTYSMLVSLSNESKSRLQRDGMGTSRWLQALAQFCGKVCKKYSGTMDPTPILQYVANQLRRNNAVDLIVLQEIVSSMAGIVSTSNLNDMQLQALAGGEILRQQAMSAYSDKRSEARTTSRRLLHCLSNAGLIAELLILIAQQRQTCVYTVKDEDANLKLLGNMFDEIHTVMAQYLDMLQTNVKPDSFRKYIPPLDQLCNDFDLDISTAWWICRDSISQQIRARKLPAKAPVTAPEETDVSMADSQAQEVASAPSSTPNKDGDIDMKEATETPSAVETVEEAPASPWQPILEELAVALGPAIPQKVATDLNVHFYMTFWQMSIYDLYVPVPSYNTETNRLKNAAASSEKTRAKYTALYQDLQEELKTHLNNHGVSRRRLAAEKDHWFTNEDLDAQDIAPAFVELCLLPRLLISPNDASFCSRFIRAVHQLATPKFNTLAVYDNIFGKGIAETIFILSQREAENYGKFLNELLTELHAWHGNQAQYEKEALGLGTSRTLIGFHVNGVPLDYEDFRKTLYSWHRNLNNAMKICLTSKEYMQIRNAIIVLKCIHTHFPSVDWIGTNIISKIQSLMKTEKREDLKLSATTLFGLLKRREKWWKTTQQFQKSELPVARSGDKRTVMQAAGESDREGHKDSSRNDHPSGTQDNPRKVGKEVEDGEIEDGPSANTSAPATNKALPPRPAPTRPDSPHGSNGRLSRNDEYPRNQATSANATVPIRETRELPRRPMGQPTLPPSLPPKPDVRIPERRSARGDDRREPREHREVGRDAREREPRDGRDRDGRELRDTRSGRLERPVLEAERRMPSPRDRPDRREPEKSVRDWDPAPREERAARDENMGRLNEKSESRDRSGRFSERSVSRTGRPESRLSASASEFHPREPSAARPSPGRSVPTGEVDVIKQAQAVEAESRGREKMEQPERGFGRRGQSPSRRGERDGRDTRTGARAESTHGRPDSRHESRRFPIDPPARIIDPVPAQSQAQQTQSQVQGPPSVPVSAFPPSQHMPAPQGPQHGGSFGQQPPQQPVSLPKPPAEPRSAREQRERQRMQNQAAHSTAFQAPPSRPPPSGPSHQDPGRAMQSQSEIPSGPRHGRHQSNNLYAPAPRGGMMGGRERSGSMRGQMHGPSPLPSPGADGRQSMAPPLDKPLPSPSIPTGPAASVNSTVTSPVAVEPPIHPDRLKAITSQTFGGQTSTSGPPPSEPMANRPQRPSVTTTALPVETRSTASTPTGSGRDRGGHDDDGGRPPRIRTNRSIVNSILVSSAASNPSTPTEKPERHGRGHRSGRNGPSGSRRTSMADVRGSNSGMNTPTIPSTPAIEKSDPLAAAPSSSRRDRGDREDRHAERAERERERDRDKDREGGGSSKESRDKDRDAANASSSNRDRDREGSSRRGSERGGAGSERDRERERDRSEREKGHGHSSGHSTRDRDRGDRDHRSSHRDREGHRSERESGRSSRRGGGGSIAAVDDSGEGRSESRREAAESTRESRREGHERSERERGDRSDRDSRKREREDRPPRDDRASKKSRW